MVWRAGVVVVTGALAVLVATADAVPPAARLVGHVRECNTPHHCIVQPFKVSARNSAGMLVAHTTTKRHNYFALTVPAGAYALTARAAGGLTCKGAATAVAGETVHSTITCLIP